MALKRDPLITSLKGRSRGDLVQQRLCERHQLPLAVEDFLSLRGLRFGNTRRAGPDA